MIGVSCATASVIGVHGDRGRGIRGRGGHQASACASRDRLRLLISDGLRGFWLLFSVVHASLLIVCSFLFERVMLWKVHGSPIPPTAVMKRAVAFRVVRSGAPPMRAGDDEVHLWSYVL